MAKSSGNSLLIGGVDVGSSSIKATLYDAKTFKVTKRKRIRYPQNTFQENHVDVDIVFKMFKQILDEFVSLGVKGVCISSMAPIMVLVDSDLRPLTGIPYNSLRGSEYFSKLRNYEFQKMTLNALNVQMLPHKIMWVKENLPTVFKRSRWILDLNGYIFNRLMENSYEIPVQDINTSFEWGLVRHDSMDWWHELVHDLGVTEKLPILVQPEFSGTYRTVEVSIGTVDTILSALGLLGISDSKMFASNGSTLCAGFVSDVPANSSVLYNDIFFEDRFLVNGCNSQYSTVMDWVHDIFGRNVDVERIDINPRSVLFLPYLLGERCPVFSPELRGGFFGLEKSTTQDDLIASVVHSLAYLSADMISNLVLIARRSPNMIVAGGGFSKQNLGRIISSLTNMKYLIVDGEPGTLGAALVSMKSLKLIKHYPADTEKFGLKEKASIDPDPSYRVHEENFHRFTKLRNALSEIS